MAEIKNPNQQGGGGGQDSRTILIFTSLFLVLFLGLQYFKTKNQPATPAGHSQTAATTTTPPSQRAVEYREHAFCARCGAYPLRQTP